MSDSEDSSMAEIDRGKRVVQDLLYNARYARIETNRLRFMELAISIQRLIVRREELG